jgi:DNA-binding NarL/FixJ family response regulator
VSDLPRSEALLDAVHRADEAMWDPKGGVMLTDRNDAVRAALAGGWSAEEIARHVSVASVDVDRWAGLTTA